MKKMWSNFMGSSLSRNEMRKISGGCGSAGTITCGNGSQHAASAQTALEMGEIVSLVCNGGGTYQGSGGWCPIP